MENFCTIETLLKIFEDYSYPEESRRVFAQAYGRIAADPAANAAAGEILGRYAADILCDQEKMREDFAALAAPFGIHEYTAKFLLYLLLLPQLEKNYEAAKLPHEIFVESAADLKYKLTECRLVKGIWGSFVTPWFRDFYALRLFSFGLLQFRRICYNPERHHIRYEKDGFCLTADTPLIDVHIPRTGKHLDHDEVMREYRRAAVFFRERFGVERAAFFCASWLLFPPNLELLRPDSNLARFIRDFDILYSSEFSDYTELWRLFDMDYTGDPDALPADTSFRRGYIRWLKEGRKTGRGIGIFLPEKDF